MTLLLTNMPDGKSPRARWLWLQHTATTWEGVKAYLKRRSPTTILPMDWPEVAS